MLPKGSIAKVYEYYFTAPQFSEEVMRALREFYDRSDLNKGDSLETTEQSEAFFNEWFLYDFALSSGGTVLEDFVANNPLKMKDAEKELYRRLLNTNKYGIFEVLDLERGQSIMVKDLQTGKQVLVCEFSGTFDLEKGYIFFGRIGKVADHYELVGADSLSLQGVDEATKKSFRREKFKLTPKVANEILRRRESNYGAGKKSNPPSSRFQRDYGRQAEVKKFNN